MTMTTPSKNCYLCNKPLEPNSKGRYTTDCHLPCLTREREKNTAAAAVNVAAEREAKKLKAYADIPGRVQLGHWRDAIEVKDARDTIKMEFVTKVTTRNAATVEP